MSWIRASASWTTQWYAASSGGRGIESSFGSDLFFAEFSVELLATGASTAASAAELQRLRMELDAERALRRETQQEALRSRAALEALQMKRAQDHAYLRDVVKRQRRCLERIFDGVQLHG